MKVVTVIGARPQFVKAAMVSRAFAQLGGAREVIVHTGQHFDVNMSEVFFSELAIPAPAYHLAISGGGHGSMTGRMLERLEDVLLQEHPDAVLVYGDTNSTLAGALAASKLNIPVVHVEAGLRSYNRTMPEEINRIVTDRLATLNCCPTRRAVENLKVEGMTDGVYFVGDVMFDATQFFSDQADREWPALASLGLTPKRYCLATIHRSANTDDPSRLQAVLECLAAAGDTVVLPLHPRTAQAMNRAKIDLPSNVLAIEPVGYLRMLALERNARAILTDSGGVQKEALWAGVPCLTLRDETEWVESLESGWNTLVGLDVSKVQLALNSPNPMGNPPAVYGDGSSAMQIARLIENCLG